MSVNLQTLILALLAATACSPWPSAAPARPMQSAAPARPTPSTSQPIQNPSLTSNGPSALETHVAEMARASDARNYAVRLEQTSPANFVPFEWSSERIPPFTSVVAHVVNFDRAHRRPLAPSSLGCRGAVANDGSLCPSVVVPGARLSAAQVSRLEALFRMRSPVASTTGCAGPARHSFVFYSGAGVPVFEWLVDLRCGRGSQSNSLLPPEALDGVVRLCRELGVGLCFLADSREREDAERAFTARFVESPIPGVRRLKPFPTRVAADRTLASLTPGEKRELCAWNAQHTVTALEPGGDARANEAGAKLRLLALDECVHDFPRCAATLDALRTCMDEAQRGAPVLATFSSPTCLVQRECLWGFALSAPAASPTRPSTDPFQP